MDPLKGLCVRLCIICAPWGGSLWSAGMGAPVPKPFGPIDRDHGSEVRGPFSPYEPYTPV